MITVDVAVIGAGIAGASLAAEIAREASVLLIEGEAQPGYHATGRSAAFWSETYGGPGVQPLTTASGGFLASPPAEFSERGFLSPRGAVHVARSDAGPLLESFRAAFAGQPITLVPLAADALASRIPGLREDWTGGVAEPACSDIDVAALHAAYLASFRRRGGRLLVDSHLRSARQASRAWDIVAGDKTIGCGVLANAAGAWADGVASLAGVPPLGLQPYRRTVAQLRIDPPAPADLPLVIDVEGGFYFKGETGGRIWLSPHDETASEPCDTAPQELDIALAINRFEQVVDWRVERVERSWAGLRTFTPDRLPVYGYDREVPNFFWCAGQGGFGIQTAPAAARLAAGVLLGKAPDPMIAHIDTAAYSPGRFG